MRQKALMILLALCLMASTGSAFAQARSAQIELTGGPESVMTPEDRVAAWLGAFNSLVAENSDLSPDQVKAISQAVETAEPALFVDRPSIEARSALFGTMETLREELPCATYSDLLSKLGGVSEWMAANRLAASGDCGCNSDAQCASGWSCESTTCTSPKGSTNWGQCQERPVIE